MSKGITLLDEFDVAAQDWGWNADCGTGKRVSASEAVYDESREALRTYILDLETTLAMYEAQNEHRA